MSSCGRLADFLRTNCGLDDLVAGISRAARAKTAIMFDVDPDLARRVADAYAAGASQRAVSEQFGVYPRIVREALRQEGVTARTAGSRFEDPAETQAWVERYRLGETMASISLRSGYGVYAVQRRLRAAGVVINSRPGPRHIRWEETARNAVLARYQSGNEQLTRR